jgi:uncharacterized membrane protein
MPGRKIEQHHLAYLALLFASGLATMMIIARALVSGRLVYGALVWNLFLAWLPLLFAWLAHRLYRRREAFWLFSFLWLLFSPNALYLVTDLVHLRPRHEIPLWYDAIMLFSFALTGLLLGVISLYLMQGIVTRRWGRLASWLFVLVSVSLNSLGVYIGRFLRWNSWDLFSHPFTLLRDVLHSLIHPQLIIRTYTVSFLLSAVLLVAYVVFYALGPQIELRSKDNP